jgi:hypothetical protein
VIKRGETNIEDVSLEQLAERLGLYLLTKCHASDMTDRTKQAHQGQVTSFHAPSMTMKGRILGASDTHKSGIASSVRSVTRPIALTPSLYVARLHY